MGGLLEISQFNIRIIKEIKNILLLFGIIFRSFSCGLFGDFCDALGFVTKNCMRGAGA